MVFILFNGYFLSYDNSIEFLLDFLYYLYNYYMVCALSSHTHYVTSHVTPCDCDPVTSYSYDCDNFPYSFLCSKSKKKSKVK